jgi:hypothetical protein
MSYAVTITVAMLLGFLAGLLSFKVKSRWCPTCGAVKCCPACTGWAKPVVTQPDPETTLPISDCGRPDAAGRQAADRAPDGDHSRAERISRDQGGEGETAL